MLKLWDGAVYLGREELPQPSVWGDRSSSLGRRDSEIAAADTVDAVGWRGGFLCGSPHGCSAVQCVPFVPFFGAMNLLVRNKPQG